MGREIFFSITVDYTFSNDIIIAYFKKKLLSWGAFTVRVKFLHMRCVSQILNLIVNDGLKEVNVLVKRLRKLLDT